MALTAAWKVVSERLQYLERYEDIRPIVLCMQRLVATLRDDPRLNEVTPSVSLASLNLRLGDSERYVNVVSTEGEPLTFKVSFVDPTFVFSETKTVSNANVVATIIQFVDCLKGLKDQQQVDNGSKERRNKG